MPRTVLYHLLALNPCALDIRHQLIKILVEWQIKGKNTYGLGIGCQTAEGMREFINLENVLGIDPAD
jgi:hypothetical protein